MSTKLSNEIKGGHGWDQAIRDAEEELHSLERQRLRLQQAIRIFKINKKERLQWPTGRIIGQKG
jgi:hypothetical protein